LCRDYACLLCCKSVIVLLGIRRVGRKVRRFLNSPDSRFDAAPFAGAELPLAKDETRNEHRVGSSEFWRRVRVFGEERDDGGDVEQSGELQALCRIFHRLSGAEQSSSKVNFNCPTSCRTIARGIPTMKTFPRALLGSRVFSLEFAGLEVNSQ